MGRYAEKALALLLCCALGIGMVGLTGCASIGTSPDGAGTPGQSNAGAPGPAAQDDPLPPVTLLCDLLTGAAPDEATMGLRPVAVMIDNIQAALPQSGIADAAVVYEMVTEGGITRMMAVYPSIDSLPRVGPVRSTRDQFVQLMVPQDIMLLHIGCSVYAADMLRAQNYTTVDGIYLGTVAFAMDEVRAQGRDNSHCFYTNAELAAAGIAHEGMTTVSGNARPLFSFMPYDEAARVPQALRAGEVAFSFSMVAPAAFRYDAGMGAYLKSEYGDPQMDEDAGVQLHYTNLLILGCDVSLKSDGLCTDFDLSSGEGYYFSQGAGQPVYWQKGGVTDPLVVYDAAGNELRVNVGNSYIAFMDNRALARSLTVDGVLLSAEEAGAEVPENGAGAD